MICKSCDKETNPNKHCDWFCGECGEPYKDTLNLNNTKVEK